MSGPDPLPALRTAASVLLNEAPMGVVRALLRVLLSDAEPMEAPTAVPVLPPRALEPKPNSQKPTPKPPDDGAWDAQRREVRRVMVERGVGYAELAKQFSLAVLTLRQALGKRRPPSAAMRERLEAWLTKASAPAVAAAPTFRANGSSHSSAGGKGHAIGASDTAERAAAG